MSASGGRPAFIAAWPTGPGRSDDTQAQVTALTAANLAYELITLRALSG